MERSLDLVPEETAAVAAPATATRRERAWTLDARVAAVLVVVMLLGFGLRVRGISELGFAEDEINKLEAVGAYARGDITPNA